MATPFPFFFETIHSMIRAFTGAVFFTSIKEYETRKTTSFATSLHLVILASVTAMFIQSAVIDNSAAYAVSVPPGKYRYITFDPDILNPSNQKAYARDEIITFSGYVAEEQLKLEQNKDMKIMIYRPDGAICKSDNINVDQDSGSFSYSFRIDCSEPVTGRYSFVIGYEDSLGIGSEFMYVASPYELRVNEQVYPIDYKINDGKVMSMTTDFEEKSLVIQTKDVGQLTIDLPREVIDSKSGTGDLEFQVFVNGEQTPFKEIQSNGDTRTLLINLCDGQKEDCHESVVKIIGTNVVPEFGLFVGIVMSATLAAVIALSKLGKPALFK